MPVGSVTEPRPYLRADVRQRQLLDAAARLFVRDGFAGMTMVALAAEAGVSRRLVYNHFPDLAALYDAFFDDRAARYLVSIDHAIADGAGDLRVAFAGAFSRLLTIPADDQRVIRLLVADPGLPELDGLRERFRHHVEERWLGFAAGSAVDPGIARALLWTVVSGLFGLVDLVGRGEISPGAATHLAAAFVASLPRVIADVTPWPQT